MTRKRRAFLASIGLAGASTLLAGCSGNETTTSEPQDTPTETTETPTETTTETPTETATATETETGPAVTPPEEPPRSASQIDPDDGFAEMAPWLEEEAEDVEIRHVTQEDLDRRSFIKKMMGPGPRVVVFDTSGTIDLEGETLSINNGKLWIAGQTAPSPGITFTHGSLKIEGDDCVIQHVRVRPGDGADSTPDSMDSIFTQDEFNNSVVDHCSVSWSLDENMSVGYDSNNTTVTNCLVAEPLDDSLHSKGPHGYNSLIGDNSDNVTLAGNVYANATDRNPRLKEGNQSVVVNNLVHHYEDGCMMNDDDGQPVTRASFIGNVYDRPQSDKPAIFAFGDEGPEAYLEDNDVRGGVPTVDDVVIQLEDPPLWPDDLEPMSSGDVKEHNLKHAGARPADRTEHDQRIVEMIRNGEGHVIDSQEEVGGYPELEENTHELTVPDSNLRAWLRQHARRVEPDQ